MRRIVAFIAGLIFAFCAGCSTARLTLPDGATYERTALLHKLEVDEAMVTKGADGLSVTIKGGRSDSTRALDVASEALQRVPKVP